MIAVIYCSKYGSTKKYAEWIAGKCLGDLYHLPDFPVLKLNDYDTVIFGSSVYAGRVRKIGFLKDNWDVLRTKRVVLFTVTAAPADSPVQAKIFSSNLPESMREGIKHFPLQGAYDHSVLSLSDRILMLFPRTLLWFQSTFLRSEKAKEFREMVTVPQDWKKEEYVEPIVSYACGTGDGDSV